MLSRNDAFADGERGRLDRSRRRPADELVALALAHQTVIGICRANCSARRRTERPGRSRSPFPTASSGLVEPQFAGFPEGCALAVAPAQKAGPLPLAKSVVG